MTKQIGLFDGKQINTLVFMPKRKGDTMQIIIC